MPDQLRKIINDPVYGFITVNSLLAFEVISHRYFQRLRRITQMAMAMLVYPGAVHTRLHHSLGAYHLMCQAVLELRSKGIAITTAEEDAVKAAILMHDIGHGPYSHALENTLLPGISHEEIGLEIMQLMNTEMDGRLTMAIDIFTNRYHKQFLHQLVSGQLDMDRMDYLTRDSFFTGVSEGVIGYDRILKMLVVQNGQLMVEEKGIYSIEKFLVARRLMYWQVYLHKTVLVAEKMLINITTRVRHLHREGDANLQTNTPVDFFITQQYVGISPQLLKNFCQMDDYDIVHCLKVWSRHSDIVLSTLCHNLLNRTLLKIKLTGQPVSEELLESYLVTVGKKLNITTSEAAYFVFAGETTNTMYKTTDERINILFKTGEVKDISQVDNALIHKTLTSAVKKFYFCFFQ